MALSFSELKEFLEEKYNLYNRPEFIETDPIQVAHSFSKREDIEISSFLSSSIAWGQRKTIIQNAKKIAGIMGNNPYDFLMEAKKSDFNRVHGFVHRTFNDTDLIYYLKSLQNIYRYHGGLRNVFESNYLNQNSVKDSLIAFRQIFFEIPDYQKRTSRHISDVMKNAAAKRLNLFLMWMVRRDNRGVHFGLWNNIPSSALFIPLDIHTGNMSRKLGLLNRNQNDWKSVEELTSNLRLFDPYDPVKYDFALFGLGVFEKF